MDEMAVAKPLWGAPRIHSELRKVGELDVKHASNHFNRVVARVEQRDDRFRGLRNGSSQVMSDRGMV
jgi:hypothetical protein